MDKVKRYIPYLLLTGLTLFFCRMFVGRYGIFGAKVDWLSQHSVLPDYFRQQFYGMNVILCPDKIHILSRWLIWNHDSFFRPVMHPVSAI